MSEIESLEFVLDVEDGWPPVGIECLPMQRDFPGYRLLVAPLFVKGLSVHDVIEVTLEDGHRVFGWKHLSRSKNTTVWLLLLKSTAIDELKRVLEEARLLGCDCSHLEALGFCSINVPAAVPIADVDALLETLDPEAVAVAFPSMRHPEPDDAPSG